MCNLSIDYDLDLSRSSAPPDPAQPVLRGIENPGVEGDTIDFDDPTVGGVFATPTSSKYSLYLGGSPSWSNQGNPQLKITRGIPNPQNNSSYVNIPPTDMVEHIFGIFKIL